MYSVQYVICEATAMCDVCASARTGHRIVRLSGTGYDCTGLDGQIPYTVYGTVCERFASFYRESIERRGNVECGVL